MPVKSFEDIQKLGGILESSCMFGCNKPGQGTVLALTCMMEKITPLQFRNTYHLINGVPSKRAEAMLAEFRTKHGGKYTVVKHDAEVAEIHLEYQGNKFDSIVTWKEMAKQPFIFEKDGKTLKPNWSTEFLRTNMLWSRAVSTGIRVVAPEVNSGVYTPEETQDFVDVEAVAVVDAPKKVSAKDVAAAIKIEAIKPGIEKSAPVKVDTSSQKQETTKVEAPKAETQAPSAVTDALKSAKVDVADFGPIAAPGEVKPNPAVEPFKIVDAEIIEPEDLTMIVPIGNQKGKKLTDLSDKLLGQIVAVNNPAFTQAHKDNAAAILARRNAAKGV